MSDTGIRVRIGGPLQSGASLNQNSAEVETTNRPTASAAIAPLHAGARLQAPPSAAIGTAVLPSLSTQLGQINASAILEALLSAGKLTEVVRAMPSSQLDTLLGLTQRQGLNYILPTYNGSVVSHATGDEAWYAGAYNRTADFFTLRSPNRFGNYLRFTNLLGNAITLSDAYVIDHAQNLGILKRLTNPPGTLVLPFGPVTWANAVSYCQSLVWNGWDDFFLPTYHILDSWRERKGNGNLLPFQWLGLSSAGLWCSNSTSATLAPLLAGLISYQDASKTSSAYFIPVRTHYHD